MNRSIRIRQNLILFVLGAAMTAVAAEVAARANR